MSERDRWDTDLILDLCSGSEAWSQPYREAGYTVTTIDIRNGQDVRLLKYSKEKITGILAAPPCTHLSGSGARWWAGKGEGALLDALGIVDACLRAVVLYDPDWWCLENPVGRLVHYLGKPTLYFQPYEFAGWADAPGFEAYTKKTCLWGRFTIPDKKPVEPVLGGKIWRMPPSPDRGRLRSITPSGFARAFYAANP